MTSRPDLAGLVVHPDFDGHPTRNFSDMTAEERLDDLSCKIALVLKLRKARLGQITDGPAALRREGVAEDTGAGGDGAAA